MKTKERVQRVQNRFLSFIAFLLKIEHTPHDYTFIHSTLNIPSMALCCDHADSMFITSPLNSSIDSPELLATFSFCVPTHSTRHHSLFSVPTHLI